MRVPILLILGIIVVAGAGCMSDTKSGKTLTFDCLVWAKAGAIAPKKPMRNAAPTSMQSYREKVRRKARTTIAIRK